MTPVELGLSCLMLLAALLAVAVWQDLRHRRIPNPIVFGGAAMGILLNTVTPHGMGFLSGLPGGLGFASAVYGLGLGLGVMLPFYVLRLMGAGDVKLIAMVGTFLGPDVLGAVLGTLVAGGILALVWAAKTGATLRMFRNLRLFFYSGVSRVCTGSMPTLDDAAPSVGDLPYAATVALGTLGYLVFVASRLTWTSTLLG